MSESCRSTVSLTSLLCCCLLYGFQATLAFAPAPVRAQEAEPKIWLPLRHADALNEEMAAIIDHAATRAGCEAVLEARVQDNSPSDNPKFIITCRSGESETLNLVYWLSDVANDFADVAYPEARQLAAEAAAAAMFDAELRLALVDACKSALRSSMNGELPAIDGDKIQFRERSSSVIAIYMEFRRNLGAGTTPYLATCLGSPDLSVRLAVNPL